MWRRLSSRASAAEIFFWRGVEPFVPFAGGDVRLISGCLAGRFFAAVVCEKDGEATIAKSTDVKNAIFSAGDMKVIFVQLEKFFF
jgi:hypothetical protein